MQVVVDVCGPDGCKEEQHLMSQEMHGHIEECPGIRQRLQHGGRGLFV